MNKLIRLYNQNRFKIWTGVIIIIFIFVIIRLLNFAAKKELQQDIQASQTSKQTEYENQSQSIVSGGEVEKVNQDKYGQIIDKFLTECIGGGYDRAYEQLSEQCKDELYPTVSMFKDKYCIDKFDINKEYTFQSWTSTGVDIYRIKIFENRLITGNSSPNYIEDYYSLVKEGNEYKLNINGFIGEKKHNKNAENEGIKITVEKSNIYMNYRVYTLTVHNTNKTDIILDTKENSNATYVVDTNNVNREALLNENTDEELRVNAGESKKIEIKFNTVYQSGVYITKIVFSNIITDVNNGQDFTEVVVEV